jgi:GNAT superfamily N-acetyltransferase
VTVSCSSGRCCFQVRPADLPDLLAPLYNLPPLESISGFWIGNPLPHQRTAVLDFIESNFGKSWRDEASAAFAEPPVRLEVAVDESNGEILAFCCWDCTAKGFLGPVGVTEKARGRGVGRAVVISVLHRMREAGYGYAIIGGAGPVEFFQSLCDARVIDGSESGIYGNPIN